LTFHETSLHFPKRDQRVKKGRGTEKEEASGAGSIIPDRELGTGISRTMQRIVHEEVDEVEDIAFHNFDEDVDMDSDSDADQALTRFQRGEGKQRSEEQEQGTEKQNGEGQNYWRTFKYRPILGICIIGDLEEGEGVGPEVALVERPIWEADLGPRYFGDQEWEKNGVDL